MAIEAAQSGHAWCRTRFCDGVKQLLCDLLALWASLDENSVVQIGYQQSVSYQMAATTTLLSYRMAGARRSGVV